MIVFALKKVFLKIFELLEIIFLWFWIVLMCWCKNKFKKIKKILFWCISKQKNTFKKQPLPQSQTLPKWSWMEFWIHLIYCKIRSWNGFFNGNWSKLQTRCTLEEDGGGRDQSTGSMSEEEWIRERENASGVCERVHGCENPSLKILFFPFILGLF